MKYLVGPVHQVFDHGLVLVCSNNSFDPRPPVDVRTYGGQVYLDLALVGQADLGPLGSVFHPLVGYLVVVDVDLVLLL